MNKKVWIILVSALALAIIGIGVYLFIVNSEEELPVNEIQPEEEISDEQMRQTIATVYYQNKETKELTAEGRLVDVKTLFTDPYATLVNLLIAGPKNESLKSTIPVDTKILKIELKGDIVYIDFSSEFIDNHEGGLEAENATVYSIVNTLTELNEVNGVKILINGKENQTFKDKIISLKDPFSRNESLINYTNSLFFFLNLFFLYFLYYP